MDTAIWVVIGIVMAIGIFVTTAIHALADAVAKIADRMDERNKIEQKRLGLYKLDLENRGVPTYETNKVVDKI